MTAAEPQPEREEAYQSLAMLRERLDAHERQIKELWRRIHSLSETIEDLDVH